MSFMRWRSQDIHMFEQTKEYVDTIVIPLLPISFAEDMKQTVEISEFIQLLTVQMEQQLKGRIMLLPGFTYLKTTKTDSIVTVLCDWEEQLLNDHFKHVFYVTSESDWNNIGKRLTGKLIFLSPLTLHQLDEQNKTSLLKDQLNDLLNLFYQKWREV